MATQIIDGFQVNTASPIDNRIVASGSTARNAIPYKYHGLRVFDISDNVPYVWNSSSWVSENASGVVGSNTIVNYIPLYTSTNVVSNSVIYQVGSNIGVNTLSPSATFSVNGSLSATTLSGNGSSLTNLNASNLSSGSLSLSRLSNGSSGWLLSGASGAPVYVNPSQVSVGTASVALSAITSASVSVSNSTSNSSHYLTFVQSSGNIGLRTNTSGLEYNPNNQKLKTNGGEILLSSGSANSSLVTIGCRSFSGTIGNASTLATIATVGVLSNSSILVEATFTGYIIQGSGVTAKAQYRTTKLISTYWVNYNGVITQMGSTNTILDNNAVTGLSGPVIYTGQIDISTANSIIFKQDCTGISGPLSSYNFVVDYKVTTS
jgi:hypothetical protein